MISLWMRVLVPLISNADLEKTKPKFIHNTSETILQYSFFFNWFSRGLTLFLELCSYLYDLPANSINPFRPTESNMARFFQVL